MVAISDASDAQVLTVHNGAIKSLKILFISDVYFPRVNGVSTSIKTFIDQMQTMGHTVHLIAPDYGVKTTDEAWIKRIPARKIYFDPEDQLMKFGQAIKRLPELMAEQYDVIHVNTPFIAHYLGIKLGKKLNVPVIETYHTFFEDYLHHYLPWLPQNIARGLARIISRTQCNAVDAIVSPSQPMLDVLRAYGVKTAGKVIPTGLQESSFELVDLDFRAKFNIASDRPMLLYVGRVAYEKNIEFLLCVVQALQEQLPDLLLVVTGEGPAEHSLKQLSKSLNIQHNVMFIGYLDRNTELNACYRSADVFVFASTSETQGLVILEAMAQGTPVVAVAELGTKSILVEGRGARIAKEDTMDFAEKVQEVLNDHRQRLVLEKSALEYVRKEWTAKRQAERMLDFYYEVIVNFQMTHVSHSAPVTNVN
jgi:1,2-diacylglycerol 3-alpha-glucosyltransferase